MRPTLRLLLAVSFAAACGAEPAPTPSPEGPHALYSSDPASLDNPFPDARLFAEGGGLDVARRPHFARPFLPRDAWGSVGGFFGAQREVLADVRGFGGFAPVLVRFSDELAPQSLVDAEGRSRFAFVQAGADGRWARGAGALVELPAEEVLRREGRFFAMVRPVVPLAPDGPAALVLLAGATARDGRPLVRAPDFDAAVRAGDAGEVAAAAAALAVDASEVVFSMPLKPVGVTGELLGLVPWAARDVKPRVQLPPKATEPLPRGVFRQGEDDLASVFANWTRGDFPQALEHVGTVAIGQFAARDFRDSRRLWSKGPLEAPESAPEVMLDFVLTLPRGPRPAGGYRVVIGGHGVGGRNSPAANGESFCLRVAEWLAEAGLGCIGIDAADHGNRGGITDFFSITDLRVMRDDFRQTAADQMQLVQLIRALDLDADGAPDLDPVPGYFGNSMGGIMGATFVALDERVREVVLNVPGAGLSDVMLSAAMRDRLGLLFSAATGVPFGSEGYDASFPLLRAVAQLVIDPGDPVHYAGRLAGRRVLVQEGLGDRTVPNLSTRTLVLAAGLPRLEAPVARAAGASGWVSIDPVRHGIEEPAFDAHNIWWRIDAVRQQAIHYLVSQGTEIPEIP